MSTLVLVTDSLTIRYTYQLVPKMVCTIGNKKVVDDGKEEVDPSNAVVAWIDDTTKSLERSRLRH
jgi:hypothetical protein